MASGKDSLTQTRNLEKKLTKPIELGICLKGVVGDACSCSSALTLFAILV